MDSAQRIEMLTRVPAAKGKRWGEAHEIGTEAVDHANLADELRLNSLAGT